MMKVLGEGGSHNYGNGFLQIYSRSAKVGYSMARDIGIDLPIVYIATYITLK